MNDRIRQLADEAGLRFTQHLGGDRTLVVDGEDVADIKDDEE